MNYVDTILHIGAGRCGEFPKYELLGARRIILVEADEKRARYLLRAYENYNHVQVLSCAVSDVSGPITLKQYNLQNYNSIREATGLRQIYPGLRQTGELEVESVTLSKLVGDLCMDYTKKNLLVIDTPGEEMNLVDSLGTDNLFEMFETVTLYCAERSLFVGAQTADNILSVLYELGYELIARDDEKDPNRPRWTLNRNKNKIENIKLRDVITTIRSEHEKERKKLRSEIDNQVQKINEYQKAIEKIRKEKELKEKELNELNEKNNSHEKNIEKLNTIKKELDNVLYERDKHIKLILDNFEKWEIRQEKQHNEILQAEGQIEAIKKLLLI